MEEDLGEMRNLSLGSQLDRETNRWVGISCFFLLARLHSPTTAVVLCNIMVVVVLPVLPVTAADGSRVVEFREMTNNDDDDDSSDNLVGQSTMTRNMTLGFREKKRENHKELLSVRPNRHRRAAAAVAKSPSKRGWCKREIISIELIIIRS